MGGCCSGGSAAKYAKTPAGGQTKDASAPSTNGAASSPSLACSACRLTQTIPANTPIYACQQCRHPIVNPGAISEAPWENISAPDGTPELTVHSGPRPRVGETVRLAPCCLYYDAQCLSLGCLDSLQQEGKIIADNGFTGPEARLEVEAKNMKFQYKLGCVEEAELVRWHDELFRRFAVPSTGEGKQELVFGPQNFCEFMKVTTQEEGDLEVFGAICVALGVHPTQGLTSGDFRRMYSEFEGDLHEDWRIVCQGGQPSKDKN